MKEDGTLEYDTGDFLTGSNKNIAYKEDSEAYKEALDNHDHPSNGWFICFAPAERNGLKVT